MIHLDHLLRATGGRLIGQAGAHAFPDFCYDSRLINPGELFLAVKTATGDGHDYIADAVRQGAGGVLCERAPADLPRPVTVIQVSDTQQALLDWAEFILRTYRTQVVGITGSTGKTSAKEAIAIVLATRFPVFRNYANYNGRYGLPIALGRLEPAHRIAVLEMACDAFDEIRLLAELTRPQVGVVTAVSAAHLATFGTLENIAQEKGQLVRALPADGWAILNADDPLVRDMAGWTRAHVLTFGFAPDADLRILESETGWEGTQFLLESAGTRWHGRLALVGRHSAYTAAAAVAVGLVHGIPPEEALEALAALSPIPGRLYPLEGVQGARLLDDTYNASPASTMAALDALEALPAGRRIALMGWMSDVGSFEEEAYRQIGKRAAGVVAHLVLKDERARGIARAAQEAGLPAEEIFLGNTDEELIAHLRAYLQPDDALLAKGGVEVRLENVVKALMRHPEAAGEKLVRQNRAWQSLRLVRPGRPTWVEVDLGAIANNMRRIAEMVGPAVRIMAVLKADAYGHGAVRVARTVLNNGASYVGVACVGEAEALRQAGITAPILVLGYTPAWQARQAVLLDAAVTLFSEDDARAFSRAAQELNRPAVVHVKVDTGMGRLGLLPHEVLSFVQLLLSLPGLELEGIFTHFSTADAGDKAYTRRQVHVFRQVLEELQAQGIRIPLIHAANSPAALSVPESHFNMVRVGLALYGLHPSEETPLPPGFRPALSFKTQIAQVKLLPPGSYISYGNTYRTQGYERVAVIPVGYADGFRRAPAHWGEVLVKGRRAPILGRVCMDQTVINVSDIPDVRQGDEVVLIGRQGAEEITAEEVARRLGTINYEVVSEILARVPRVT